MTLEERIDAAEAHIVYPEGHEHEERPDTIAALKAAFPELFAGTHVLVPREELMEVLFAGARDIESNDLAAKAMAMIAAYEEGK